MTGKEEIQLNVPSADIPLWLLERRKLPKDWGKKLKLVQSKYEKVFADINSKSNLSNIQDFINTHKERILVLLVVEMELKNWAEVEQMLISSPEGKEKTIFGRYLSPLIKDVRLIVAMLKKDNLYLADIGKEITARIQFEM
jgi:hypothetical protein